MCCIKKIWVTALRKSDNRRHGLSRAYIAKNSMSLSIHFGQRRFGCLTIFISFYFMLVFLLTTFNYVNVKLIKIIKCSLVYLPKLWR